MRRSGTLFVSVSCLVLCLLALPMGAAPLPALAAPSLSTPTAAPTAPAVLTAPIAATLPASASLASLTDASSAPDAAVTESTPRIQTIGVARRRPVGTRVTIEGSVTVPSGTFSSSFGDEGFAIQDFTGGVYVSTADNLGLKLQDRVRVTGVITESGGLISVVPADASGVTDEGKAWRVRPLWVRTGQVGPANQGLLIYCVGTITQPIEPDPPYGQKVFINDGSGELRVFINTSADIDISTLTPGEFISVTGFSSAFDTPELDPRFQSDIKQPGGH